MTATNAPTPGEEPTSFPEPRPIDLDAAGHDRPPTQPADPVDVPQGDLELDPWAAEGQSCQVYGEDGIVYLISTGVSDEFGPGVMAMGLTPEQADGLAGILWDTARGESPEVFPDGVPADGEPEQQPTGWASRMRVRAQKATTDPGRIKQHLEDRDTDSPVAGMSWLTLIILAMLVLTVLALIVSWF